MNRESFSDPEIAALINDNFIPILVDREERPDMDMLYQGAAGIMGHPGGWPLNIFLTSRWRALLGAPAICRAKTTPGPARFRRVLRDTPTCGRTTAPGPTTPPPRSRPAVEQPLQPRHDAAPETMNLDLAALRIGQRYDIFFGGLQGPMKFPNPLLLEVLWRAFLRTGTPQFARCIFTTLDGILFGGTYDHIGGGFFRHSHGRALAGAAFREDALRPGADDRSLHRHLAVQPQ